MLWKQRATNQNNKFISKNTNQNCKVDKDFQWFIKFEQKEIRKMSNNQS